MKKFELTNVAKYIKTDSKGGNLLEDLKIAVAMDGYHSFGERDLVLLLIKKLERFCPEKMKASTMLREIGLLNIYNTDDTEPLLKVLQYCISIILFIKPKDIENFN